MSTLVDSPRSEVFSALPNFRNARKNFEVKNVKSIIHKLGEIFIRHGVQDDFGLSMNHRHFKMSSEEILVQTINDESTKSLSFPWVVDGKIAKPSDKQLFQSNGLPEDISRKYVVANNWCFDKNGNILPFEFLATDEASLPQLNLEFVNELYEALKELGIEENLGIRRSIGLKGTSGWETTPKGKRVNVVVFGDTPVEIKAEDRTKVFWSFDCNGALSQSTLNCNGHQFCVAHGDDDDSDDD